MKKKLSILRRFFYPLWVIGVVYTLYLCNQILFLFLGRLLSPLLKSAWKLEERPQGLSFRISFSICFGPDPAPHRLLFGGKNLLSPPLSPPVLPTLPLGAPGSSFRVSSGLFSFCPVIPGFFRAGVGPFHGHPACGVARSLLDGSNLYGGGPF